MVESNQDVVGINHDPGWNQPGTGLESTTPPYIETLETKDRDEGEAHAREHEPASAQLDPAQLNDRPRQTNPRGTRLSDGWKPDQSVIDAMGAEYPHIDLLAEHAKFTDHWLSTAGQRGVKADWNATWRNWIRREAESPRRSGPTGGAGSNRRDAGGFTRGEAKVAGWLELGQSEPTITRKEIEG
jgi:hypothetical protein